MKKVVIAMLLVLLGALALGCAEMPRNDPGCVPMVPFTDEEQGIRGLMVNGGPQLSEYAMLAQSYVPMTWEEIVEDYRRDTGNDELPAPSRTYRGRHLEFTIFELETKLEGAGPYYYRVHSALAERGGAYYGITLLARPSDWAKNRVRYLTAFESAMYALEPIPREGE